MIFNEGLNMLSLQAGIHSQIAEGEHWHAFSNSYSYSRASVSFQRVFFKTFLLSLSMPMPSDPEP